MQRDVPISILCLFLIVWCNVSKRIGELRLLMQNVSNTDASNPDRVALYCNVISFYNNNELI